MNVPIITYHGVGDYQSPLWTPIEVFEAHLRAFVSAGYRTVRMDELVTSLRLGLPLADDALIINFDDGYDSVVREAWPRLKAVGMSATVFLVTDHCGGTNEWGGQQASAPLSGLMMWSDVESLARDGCEFGAHTRTHPCLPVLSAAAIEDEVAGSREDIREHTGQNVDVFAYPYGAMSAETVEIVRRHFVGAATTHLGLVDSSSDLCLLPRVDAWYLRPGHVRHLRSSAYRAYLLAREAGRHVRRLFRPDWNPGVAAGSEDRSDA